MADILIKEINSLSLEYQGVWNLREEVLRKPLGLSLKNEDLSDDAQDIIIIAMDDDNVIGCVMLHPKDKTIVKLRQMAVAEKYQRKGIGNILVRQAEKTARENGYQQITLHARKVAIDFYKKLDYTIISGTFTEVNIPHVAMQKTL